MNLDQIKALLQKIPITLIMVGFILYTSVEYFYSFKRSKDSPLVLKMSQLSKAQEELRATKQRLEVIEKFKKELDIKRAEIRNLAMELENIKLSLSEELNRGDFISAITKESSRAGLRTIGITPGAEGESKTYYSESSFKFNFRGFFVQILIFLERIAHMKQLVRADDFQIIPTNHTDSKTLTELNGLIQIKAFRYRASNEDEIKEKSLKGQGEYEKGSLSELPNTKATQTKTKGGKP